MGVVSSINEGREAIRNLPTSPEAIKAAALNTCHSAIATCKGSGSIKTELGKLASTCAGLPLKVVGSGLTACKDIVTLHPVDAVCTVFKGATSACTDVAKAMISPVPMAIATAKQSVGAAKEVVKAPVTVPLAAYRVVDRGLTRVTDKLFGGDSIVPSKNSAGSKEATPLPPAPAPADLPQAA